MHIFYLYNEKLPKKTAHDSYVWRNCYYLSEHGLDVTLVTGTSQYSLDEMAQYYIRAEKQGQNLNFLKRSKLKWFSRKLDQNSFHWHQLPLLRKSPLFRLSWNLPFFYRCQNLLKRKSPDWVLFSVYKQAHFHLQRRLKGVKYLFEVHELAWYPPTLDPQEKFPHLPTRQFAKLKMQLEVLKSCDKLTTTTEALKKILEQAPYNIKVPISVIGLGSEHKPLQKTLTPKNPTNALKLGYVGQLYIDQGVDTLIKVVAELGSVSLDIIGGSPKDLQRIEKLVKDLKVENRITLHGFVSPGQIVSRLKGVDVLVAPFHPTKHMRYVAHTKLSDYGRWALPVIVAKLEGVLSELHSHQFLFDATDYPGSQKSLKETIKNASNPQQLLKAQEEIANSLSSNPDRFSWKERCRALKALLV